MSSTDDLPPALPAMWRALKRGYEAAPLLLTVSLGLALAAALPDALLALWFKLLADGVLGGRRGLVTTAAVGLGVSAAATWFLRVISERTQRRFRDQVTIALESHVAWLQASVAMVEHHERPVYLDRLAMLRNQVFVLDHMYMSLFTTCGWVLRLGVTVALLVSIHPALALLAAFALPTVLTSTWRPGVERAAEERGASANRLARHLFDVATTAPPGKEVRVTRIGARLVAQRRADVPAPDRLGDGIRFEHVSFAYPGTERLVLDDVDLRLAPGSVVAIVGENGAGKTTLVKLLCRLYQPTKGRILVDGAELARMSPDTWRSRLSGAFQDFFRFELRVRHAVGVGDLPRLDDRAAVAAAVDRAGASDVVQQLVAGDETQLGATWPEGVELSFGQWQKLALARGFMRERPLVLVLDEPTAALDAETEHALFERYAAAARGSDDRITILVSHRFSTVRMADFIVVLRGSRLVESGTHEALMAKGGHYAELYRIQAAAYR